MRNRRHSELAPRMRASEESLFLLWRVEACTSYTSTEQKVSRLADDPDLAQYY